MPLRASAKLRLQQLIKLDQTTIEWLSKYLQENLEKQGIKKMRTAKFNLSIRKASLTEGAASQNAVKYLSRTFTKTIVNFNTSS